MRPVRALLMTCSLALLAVPAARATTVVRQTLQSLATGSDLVVRGRVERVELRAGAGQRPFRLAHVRVAEDATGRAPRVVPVRLPGGVDERGLSAAVAGVPVLAPGDEVLLFLAPVPRSATARPTVAPPRADRPGETPAGGPQPPAQWQPVALALGTWRVGVEGGEEVARPDAASHGLHQVGQTPGAALPAQVTVRGLMDRVRREKGRQ